MYQNYHKLYNVHSSLLIFTHWVGYLITHRYTKLVQNRLPQPHYVHSTFPSLFHLNQ